VLALGSLLAGLVEAILLSLLVQVGATLSAGTTTAATRIGPLAPGRGLGVPAMLAIIAGLAVVRGGLQFVVAYIPARLIADLQVRLRKQIFDLYLNASWGIQARERDGHLQDLLTYQVTHATLGVGVAASAVVAVLTFAAMVVSAFVLDPAAAVIMIVTGLVLFALFRPVSRMVRSAAVRVADANATYAADVSETVRLAEEIASFGVQDSKSGALGERADQVRQPLLRSEFVGRAGHGLYQVAAVLFVVGGLVVLDLAGTGRVASLGAVVLVLVRAASYGGTAQHSFHLVHQYAPHLDVVSAARTRYQSAVQAHGNRRIASVDDLVFRDVTFSYVPGRPAVKDASFQIGQGQAVGIVGPSGSGKSTCVQLLLRLRIPDSGDYLVNGVPADEYNRLDWARLIAYVPQEARVMAGTVADNIRFWRDGIDDVEIERAAKLAHIHDEIMELPNGYDSVIGQRADALSGGQRQRLCLARALAGRPGLLVLDEPTSALDARSESLVQESLNGLKGKLTVVIVAHRLSLLRVCDRMIVFREGRLEAFEDLAGAEQQSDYYREALARARSTDS